MRARQQSSTSYPLLFFMTLAVDHATGATGKTVTVKLSKNGASGGSAVGAVTEVDSSNLPGWYALAGNATDRNTLGPLALHATATGCDPADPTPWDIITVDPFAANLGIASVTLAADQAVNTTKWAGGTIPAPAATGIPKTDLTYILGTLLTETAGLIAAGFKKFFNVATPTGTVNSLPDAVPGAAGGVFIAGANAATSITTALTANVTGNVTGNLSGSVGSVAGNVVGSVGNLLDISAAALARFFTRDSGSTYAASVAGSVVREIASNAATSVATIAGAVWNALRASYVVSGSFGEGIATILTQTGLIGTTGLTMNAPQFNSLNYPLVAGRTYKQIYGNALQFALANTSIDLTASGISFSLNLKPNGTPTAFVGTALTSQTGYFEVSADETADWVTTANADGTRVYGDIVIYVTVGLETFPIDVTVGWLKVVPGVNSS